MKVPISQDKYHTMVGPLGPRFHLIVSAKEASMSSWRFLCRTRLNPVLPPYPH